MSASYHGVNIYIVSDFKQHEFLTAARETSSSTALCIHALSCLPGPLLYLWTVWQQWGSFTPGRTTAPWLQPRPGPMAKENCVSFRNIHCHPVVLSDLSLTSEFFSSVTSGSPKNVGPEIHRHTDDSLASFSLDVAGHHELC